MPVNTLVIQFNVTVNMYAEGCAHDQNIDVITTFDRQKATTTTSTASKLSSYQQEQFSSEHKVVIHYNNHMPLPFTAVKQHQEKPEASLPKSQTVHPTSKLKNFT